MRSFWEYFSHRHRPTRDQPVAPRLSQCHLGADCCFSEQNSSHTKYLLMTLDSVSLSQQSLDTISETYMDYGFYQFQESIDSSAVISASVLQNCL